MIPSELSLFHSADDFSCFTGMLPDFPPSDIADDPYIQLDKVEEEMIRTLARYKALERHAGIIKGRINMKESAFMKMLLPEIISEIFQFCAAPFRPYTEKQGKSFWTPLKIGSVCRGWRTIAWSMPELWSSLTVHLSSEFPLQDHCGMIEQYFSRSGTLPLSIRLRSNDSVCLDTPGQEALKSCLDKYSPRWIDIDCRSLRSYYDYFPCADNQLANLRTLSLKNNGGQSTNNIHINLAKVAPNLERASLSDLFIRQIHISWETITTLHLDGFYPDECLEALRLCQFLLVNFHVRNIIQGHDAHTLPEHPIILPYLETLDINCKRRALFATVMDNIAVPKLRRVRCVGLGEGGHSPVTEVSSIIERSGCPLEVLVVAEDEVNEDDILKFWARSLALNVVSYRSINSVLDDQPVLDGPNCVEFTSTLRPGSDRWDYLAYFLPSIS